jgi:hypothetical protein
MAAPTPTLATKIVAVRMPPRLERQLGAIAERDSNTVSAVVRRLLTIGLRCESRSSEADDRG